MFDINKIIGGGRYEKAFFFDYRRNGGFDGLPFFGCGVALEVRDSQLKPWEEAYHFRALFAISDYTPKELPTAEEVLNSNALDVFWNGDCVYNLPELGIVVLGNVAERMDKDYSEYFGSHRIGDRVYGVHGLRPDFDDLISRDKSKRSDAFSVPDKPITFFFKKSNLLTTNEILDA